MLINSKTVAICGAVTPATRVARTAVLANSEFGGSAHARIGAAPTAWRPQGADLTYVAVNARTYAATDSKPNSFTQQNGKFTARYTEFVSLKDPDR